MVCRSAHIIPVLIALLLLSLMPAATAQVGDLAARIAVYRPSTREWLVRGDDASSTTIAFGGPGDVPVPGDYLGKGAAQIAVFRPNSGEWFVREEGGSTRVLLSPGPGATPVPADYFARGHQQVAVYLAASGEWFLRDDNGRPTLVQFGAPEDVPVPADYLRLGRASLAVFRPSTAQWFLRTDSGGALVLPWGNAGDRPVPADYFGLGRASLAVFRPTTGEWLLRRDDDSAVRIRFGDPGDVPVPGDYRGLGRAQLAVFRPATGEWLLRRDDGSAERIAWGGPGDVPVPKLRGKFAPDEVSVATFFESFDRGFSQSWITADGSFPTESLFPFRPNRVPYAGGQDVAFQTLDGAGVARLSIVNPPSWTRFGFLSRSSLAGSAGEIEARVNPLTQGGVIANGLFDLWLVNSGDHTKFVRVGLFGDIGDTLRSWTYSSSLTSYSTGGSNPQYLPALAYRNNTWYRVRITQLPGQTLEVSVWDDAGTIRLVSHRLPHTLADLGSSFQIGFSQWMGGPHLSNSLYCAIDSISGWLTP